MLFSAIFSMESLKNIRITITDVYFSALTLAVSLVSSMRLYALISSFTGSCVFVYFIFLIMARVELTVV